MFVCNCNGIRERTVEAAIAGGARQPCEIFHQHRCKAQCGRCVEEMQAMIDSVARQFMSDPKLEPCLSNS